MWSICLWMLYVCLTAVCCLSVHLFVSACCLFVSLTAVCLSAVLVLPICLFSLRLLSAHHLNVVWPQYCMMLSSSICHCRSAKVTYVGNTVQGRAVPAAVCLPYSGENVSTGHFVIIVCFVMMVMHCDLLYDVWIYCGFGYNAVVVILHSSLFIKLSGYEVKKKFPKQSWLPAFWKKIQNTRKIKRTLSRVSLILFSLRQPPPFQLTQDKLN